MRPPSMLYTSPVMKLDSLEASHETKAATSSTFPVLLSGCIEAILSLKELGSGIELTKSSLSLVSIHPGATALQRTPSIP